MLCIKNNLDTGEISDDNLLPENSSTSSSSSAYIIGHNTDLSTEILLRLPLKSLLELKYVSKQWLSLISQPHFVRLHCLQNRPSINGLFLVKPSYGKIQEFEFIFLDGKHTEPVPIKTLAFVNDPAGLRVEQSCNGLLCCSSFQSHISKRIYYIYNPATKHYRMIPTSRMICSVSLAYDPLKSPHYKVIFIWKNDAVNYHMEIYSSETRSVRLSSCHLPASKCMFYTSGVFWNGSLHWIRLRNSSCYFDIDRDALKVMPMPQTIDGNNGLRVEYFGVCRGHMHLIQMYGTSMTHFDIFEMQSDYSGWTAKYSIDLEPLTYLYPQPVLDESVFSGEFLYRCRFSVLLVNEEEDSPSLVLQRALVSKD
ncbi:F-box protein At5g07610-like isoform X2 [Papaver somniferum]|uniref:F-box protein At5g07610-like isoform X2 n=1 Tax=Papaver somniferum TaxID=3469 RepID=UPI000E6FC3F3|nr:F-box protein At5g07610-like isoform X2 [Papaver somniferum]